MNSERKKILCWAGWYRNNLNDYKAIFIKKHLEIISEIADIYCFHIYHQKNYFWYKKFILKENFGEIFIYQIPAFFPLKIFGYCIIPLIEGIKAKKKWGKIDIFHLHISYPFAAFTFLLDFLKIKSWILTEHWTGYTYLDNRYFKINFLLKWILPKRLKKFHKISVVSDFLKKNLIQIFPNLKDKIYLTYNVINIPENIPTVKPITTSFKLLSISNLLDYHKNISFLIEVTLKAIEKIPDLELHIYGDGKDKNKFISLAQKYNLLNKHIFFHGKVENEKISEVYAQHHAFILLSKFETFSVVTAEAIAHGLPVIVSKCGAPEEYVNESNGYIVPIDDLNTSVNAVIQLYNHYNYFKPSEIQSTIKKHFIKSNIIKQFKILYS